MLMIIFGNFIATYLFEVFIIKWLEGFEHRRLERKRARDIKNDIENSKLLLKDVKY